MTIDPAAVILGLTAFGVSLLTLFSGFGLGTLLMPVFALFFPVEVAVASTAVVHAANNLFKVGLLGRSAPRDILIRFGVPAIIAAFFGAFMLTTLSGQEPLLSWSFMGRAAEVTPVKLVMGVLIIGFALYELVPTRQAARASDLASVHDPVRWLPVGGALSGFFGGLSGHQGALRAIFLTPIGLSPEQFVSTQAVLGLLVDGARLLVYGWSFAVLGTSSRAGVIPWHLVAVATVCAFAGAYLGKRLLPKVTLDSLHIVVGVLLLVVGIALAVGIA